MEKKKKIIFAGIIIILIILALAAVAIGKLASSKIMLKWKARAEYQAVFLTNGQVYFGKLSMSGKWYSLKDIYYLQVTQDLQPASGDSKAAPTDTPAGQNPNQQVGLVKLGSELHGPEDAMYISPDQVLFWENLKSDSKVVQKIHQSK